MVNVSRLMSSGVGKSEGNFLFWESRGKLARMNNRVKILTELNFRRATLQRASNARILWVLC